MSRCMGVTKKGDRCRKGVSNSSKYCRLHVSCKDYVLPKDTERCSICLEDNTPDSSIRCTQCNKYTHEECISGMIKCECPLCRADIKDLVSKNTLRAVRENKERNDEEELEETRRQEGYYNSVHIGTIIFTTGENNRREAILTTDVPPEFLDLEAILNAIVSMRVL